jgi:hypothetical protein
MLRPVALVRTDVSEEPSASIIIVPIIGELGTTLAVTNNRAGCWRPYVPLKRLFLNEPHGATSKKTTFFNTHSFFNSVQTCGANYAASCPLGTDHGLTPEGKLTVT